MKKVNFYSIIIFICLIAILPANGADTTVVVPLLSSGASAGMTVYDQNNTELGTLVDYSSTKIMVRTSNGKIVTLDGSGDISTTNLRFKDTTCTGPTVYLLELTRNTVVKNNGSYYEATGTVVSNDAESYQKDDGSCSTYSNTSQYIIQASSFTPATDLPFSLPVTPPYHVE